MVVSPKRVLPPCGSCQRPVFQYAVAPAASSNDNAPAHTVAGLWRPLGPGRTSGTSRRSWSGWPGNAACWCCGWTATARARTSASRSAAPLAPASRPVTSCLLQRAKGPAPAADVQHIFSYLTLPAGTGTASRVPWLHTSTQMRTTSGGLSHSGLKTCRRAPPTPLQVLDVCCAVNPRLAIRRARFSALIPRELQV